MAPDRKFIVWIVLRRDTSVGPHSTLVPRYSTGWSGIGDGLTRYSPMRADEVPIGDNAVLIDLWRGRLVLGRPSRRLKDWRDGLTWPLPIRADALPIGDRPLLMIRIVLVPLTEWGIKLRLAQDWHRGSGLAGLEWQIGYVMCNSSSVEANSWSI